MVEIAAAGQNELGPAVLAVRHLAAGDPLDSDRSTPLWIVVRKLASAAAQ